MTTMDKISADTWRVAARVARERIAELLLCDVSTATIDQIAALEAKAVRFEKNAYIKESH